MKAGIDYIAVHYKCNQSHLDECENRLVAKKEIQLHSPKSICRKGMMDFTLNTNNQWQTQFPITPLLHALEIRKYVAMLEPK